MKDSPTNKDTNGISTEGHAMEQTDISEILEERAGHRGEVISILEHIQAKYGYLPQDALIEVAEKTGRSLADIYGVATFYRAFSLKPRGKHLVSVCLGTACHVRGGQRIVNEIENNLGICPGECTKDMNFSLDIVRCLGACGVAPVMMLNEKIFKQVKAPQLSQTLNQYRS